MTIDPQTELDRLRQIRDNIDAVYAGVPDDTQRQLIAELDLIEEHLIGDASPEAQDLRASVHQLIARLNPDRSG